VSIPGLLNEIARRLGGLLEANERPPDFPLDLRSMADGVRKCCALDPDAALSHILLSRHIRYPVRQSLNVAILSAMLLERLKTEDARASAAVAAALTMNLSMIALQDTLYAQHGPPNEEQTLLLHAHPRAGAEELRQRGVLNGIWLKTVEQHHEARDGSGYPDGLKGDAISREAQVVTLADRYCGKVSERAYRPAYAPGAALKELHTKCAAQIDSALIGMLVALLGPYPPGTFVILANGETAIVTGRLLDLKNPVAAALYLNPRMHYEAPRKRLTGSLPQHKIAGVVSREAVTVGIDVDQLWPRTRGAPTTA
jgi:HD-GYP domain-containing protein (c-di-GMP phosphodiesterase class II)